MDIEIDGDFPGGNIEVERIDGSEIFFHQQLRDTTRDWFYWCLRLRASAGKDLHFNFTKSRALGVRGPAVSTDEGITWSWLGAETVHDNDFAYTMPENPLEVRLSFAMPYLESHWQRFVNNLNHPELLIQRTLCKTAGGRDVHYALFGNLGREPDHRVAITCRHHCCEMMANDALEGIISWTLNDSGKDARWLREHARFFAVPFVDKDGVENGDQGKGRHPRDHGRDYEGESLYASTAAIRKLVPDWGEGKLHLALDLHCPHISGPHNEVIYLVGSQQEAIDQEQRRFGKLLESVNEGQLPFHAENFLPFGTSWNTGDNYGGGKSFSRWAAEIPSIALSTGIEIPYANASDTEVNQESARSFGEDLGRAIASYLQQLS
ncbi:MAG: peptidase M14 [Candidatus Brocadiia bacterium]